MVEEDIVTRVRNCSDSFNVISSKPERVYKDVGGYFDQRLYIFGLIGILKDECVLRKLQSPFPGLDLEPDMVFARLFRVIVPWLCP